MSDADVLSTIDGPLGVKVVVRGRMRAICPLDFTVDEYSYEIEYVGRGKYLELNRLRLYLHGFWQREITHEELARTIASDIHDVLKVPVKVRLRSNYKGMEVEVEACAGGGGEQPQRVAGEDEGS